MVNDSMSIKDVLAAFGRATLRAIKSDERVSELETENAQLRTDLRNVTQEKASLIDVIQERIEETRGNEPLRL